MAQAQAGASVFGTREGLGTVPDGAPPCAPNRVHHQTAVHGAGSEGAGYTARAQRKSYFRSKFLGLHRRRRC
jgi:hypothetical protein